MCFAGRGRRTDDFQGDLQSFCQFWATKIVKYFYMYGSGIRIIFLMIFFADTFAEVYRGLVIVIHTKFICDSIKQKSSSGFYNFFGDEILCRLACTETEIKASLEYLQRYQRFSLLLFMVHGRSS